MGMVIIKLVELIRCSLSDNQELNVGAFFGLGRRSVSPIPESEFGSADTSVSMKYKYFF